MSIAARHPRTISPVAVYLLLNLTSPVSVSNYPRVTPTDLPRRVRGLDPNALAAIHDQFYPEVYRYVRYRLDDEQACEDITSEVFLRLLQSLRKENYTIENLRAWLLRTASNLVNDHFRAHYARPVTELDDESPLNAPSPEHLAEYAWQSQEIRAAVQRLTLEQQHVLALRFGDERPLEETARLMGKSVNAIKTLQFRALASLRRFLGQKESAA